MARLHRKLATAALAAALFAAVGPAQDESTLPAGDFAVHCGVLHVGDGRTMKGVYLVVRDGRIAEWSASRPADLPLFDASNKVVMPGIVAADSDLVPARDEPYNVTPDFLAVDGFDFVAPRREALAGGVTSAYVSPGRSRLVSGQGAVVKLAGTDIVRRVLADAACLRVTMDVAATRAPRLFEPTPHPTSDDPLLPARLQAPTARISLLAELRDLFRNASAPAENGHFEGSPAPEDRFDPAPLARVVAGELPLRIAAREAADIRRAIQLAKELGVRLVLEDPYEIAPVAALAAETGASAVFRVPVVPGAPNPGGEDRLRERRQPHSSPANPGIAAAVGVPVALAPASGTSLRDFLLAAAIAIRNGLPADQALRAVTLDAARILGVDDRVGSLEPAKDADIVVLSGEPFAVGTMVEATWVDGRPAYHRPADTDTLAVRCEVILTGEGESIEGGVLVATKGRIKAVGPALAAPLGATVVDIPGGVMVPGFVDACSHLGLAGEGTGVPPGTASQRVADAVLHDDPDFAGALGEGVTTVLVSGQDRGTVSGRVSAIKLGAADHRSMVLREIAALRFVHDAVGPDAIKPLRDAFERGKRYADAWAKYEKALADFKAGKGKKPEASAPATPAAKEDPLSGTWEIRMTVQGRFEITVLLDLKLEGKAVTGEVRLQFNNRELPAQEISSGTFENGKLTLEFSGMGGTATLEATVQGETMTGEISMGPMGSQEFTGERISKQAGAAPAPGAAATESGEPKKPNVDENLEPFRKIFAKEAVAVVVTRRSPAIRDVVEFFAKEKLPLVLQEADDAVDTPELLGGDNRPGVLLGPEVVEREGGSWTNAAAELADSGVPVALVTGDTKGTRHLPIHAAYAVRYGLSPEDALAALTIQPARMFGLDGRIGSLKKGKDADFVVFSGPPFELTSRVLLVVVNGRIVVDNREAQK